MANTYPELYAHPPSGACVGRHRPAWTGCADKRYRRIALHRVHLAPYAPECIVCRAMLAERS